MESSKVIAIVGGGLSGTMLAINLLRNNKNTVLTIKLIEKGIEVGRGVAYSTEEELHLLNVPVGRMSCIYQDPLHFLKWLSGKKYAYTAHDFVPRKLYRSYIQEALKQAQKENQLGYNKLETIFDEVISIKKESQGAKVYLKSGKNFYADKVVLALGNFPPAHPKFIDPDFISSTRYYSDPWNSRDFTGIKKEDPVLLIGAGLTMVDMVVALNQKGHRGEIIAVSNHGYFPFAHKTLPEYPSFYEEVKDLRSVAEIFLIVRKHVKIAKRNGSDWQAVMNAIRTHTQAIWKMLPTEERKKFFVRFKSLWEVFRHRIAPQVSDIIMSLIKSGQLKIIGGKIQKVYSENGSVYVEYVPRRLKEMKQLKVAHVLNCTGPLSNYKSNPDPLVQNLLSQGILRNDPLNLGIHANHQGQLIDAGENVSDIFFTLGPPLKGVLWESTAAPEIRDQAYHLSVLLLKYF